MKNYYVLSNGRIKREQNTLVIEQQSTGVKRPIPVEDVESLYVFGPKEECVVPVALTPQTKRELERVVGGVDEMKKRHASGDRRADARLREVRVSGFVLGVGGQRKMKGRKFPSQCRTPPTANINKDMATH